MVDNIDRKKYFQTYWKNNKNIMSKKHKEWYNTIEGRAISLYHRYKQKDIEHNRGENDLTAEWIAENILSKPCAHCGETDWHKIGCNRLDNSKPHTMDNVEPCCKECNDKLGNPPHKVYQYSIDGELVDVFNCIKDTRKKGFNTGAVSRCCHGDIKKHHGYIWSFEALK